MFMTEKYRAIEFRSDYRLSDEKAVSASRFLLKSTRGYREDERSRLYDEIVERGVSNGFARHEAAGRNLVESVDEVTAHQEFSTRVRWLDEGIWESYYEIMGRLTTKDDRLSMISMNLGFIGIKPVFLEQHWHTDDLDDPGRDYTEFQYIVGDPETIANPPLFEEIRGHLDFVTEGSRVSDSEIPRIQTFGTIDEAQLRELLPG